ncbi:MAG TPA: mechanosensitive ion channel domain-containing protein [Patescibacteria group bacterium]|nr:mechanosensitive ion channel domain-containing protein [Patescibacteria group bacterium]
MWQHPIFSYVFLGNPIGSWLLALAVFVGSWIILKLFYYLGIAKLKQFSQKTKNQIDDLVIDGIRAIRWPFYIIVSIYVAHFFLDISPWLNRVIFLVFLAGVVYYVIRFLERLVNYGVQKLIEAKEGEGEGIIKLGGSVIRLLLWLGALLLILSNLGINVTSLIAGLGVGGIAVALALQSILGDLFSSLAILLDKPFKIGDFIVVGDKMGNVEKVGIKTTRIRLLEGEELIVANSLLTNSHIRNYGPMEQRRVTFQVGVVYGTPLEKLKKVPDIIRKSIESQEKTEVEFATFKEFGDSALIFDVAFYIHFPEYVDYMKTREQINLDIAEKFQKEGIDMAFPTTTVHLKKE